MHISPSLQELRSILSDPELFSSLDTHFAMFMARLATNHSPAAALAAALVSRTTGAGNICLDLAEYAGKPLHPVCRGPSLPPYVCPDLNDWTEELMHSGVVGQGAGHTPLVLDGNNRLYLRRYWQYEEAVSRFIRERAAPLLQDLNLPRLGIDVKKLFPAEPSGEIDWQQVAAIAAVTRSFSVISGGPGTGKTATVAKILALLTAQFGASRQLHILLGAPTGKAASRLQQTITSSGLHIETKFLQASTLHRMLGSIPHSPYFRHHVDNPLNADIIVIDEASMVDLPLLAKLMQAVPAAARLILLGDRHQLASVQPGSVLGDICRSDIMARFSTEIRRLTAELCGKSIPPAPVAVSETPAPTLADSFVELVHNYRFNPESSIANLSMAVKDGDGDRALDLLLRAGDGSISWAEIPGPVELGPKLQGMPDMAQLISLQQDTQPGSWFNQLDGFRILCALRSGPFGMERVNALLEQQLAQQLHDVASQQTPRRRFEEMNGVLPYRPVMVTRNDYNLQLFNGDVGIILPDPENQQPLRVFFREENGVLRGVAPALLPAHETVFAMTVHKSQGSEFNRVLLILPDRDSPLLTRELLYTAITRAREKVEIWGSRSVFVAGVKRCIKRTSGLAEALWG